MFSKNRFAAFLVLLLFISFSFTQLAYASTKTHTAEPVLAASKSNQPKSTYQLATWLWNTNAIITSKTTVLNFLKAENVKELYLQIDTSLSVGYYQSFIRDAGALGIYVYALDGAPNFINSTGKDAIDGFFNWLKDYQSVSTDEQRFRGIHLDVEPYLLSEWNTSMDETVLNYQNFIINSRLKADALALPVNYDIPFWFDEISYSNNYGESNLADFVIQNSSGVTVMAYRDKADQIIEISRNEINLAAMYGKKVTVAVETNRCPDYPYITFFEEGKAYMNKQLSLVKQNYYSSPGFGGFAVHDYNGWKGLRK